MSAEEFAQAIKAHKGFLSQRALAVLAGVSESLLDKLLSPKGNPPKTERRQAIDLAHAVGMSPEQALSMLDHDPPHLLPHERQYLDSGKVYRDRRDRLWPRLTREQEQAVTNLLAAMLYERAAPVFGTEPDPRPPSGHRGMPIAARDHPRVPDAREDNGEDSSAGE